jgi:hypothetical protein
MATGWTIQQIEVTPWPSVLDLLSYWQENPPLHILVQAFFDKKEKPSRDHDDSVLRPETAQELQSLVNLANRGG